MLVAGGAAGARDDALCATVLAGDAVGDALLYAGGGRVVEVPEVPEVMRCMLLCLLEVLEVFVVFEV